MSVIKEITPMLSVITVSYNSSETIKVTLDSILNQSYKNIEYIVIDGNSSDSTVTILESYRDKFKQMSISYSFISEQDTGIYDAFNKGVKLSKGKWISFLGSDDYYLNNALELYSTTILNNNKNIDFVYSNVDILNDKKEIIKKINGIWSWFKFKRYMNIAHVGAFHNKEYFARYGCFNQTYKIAGDYELLLRAKSKLKTVKIEKVTAKMGNSGISNNFISLVLKETFKAKNKTAKIGFLVCSLDYMIAILKYYTKKIISAFTR